MQNFFLGLKAILLEAFDTLSQVSDYPMFWGFAMGFLTSTIVHAFLITDSPRHVSTVLFEDKSKGFQKLYPRKANGSFIRSYSEYSRIADRTKSVFLIAIFITTLLILVVVLTK